MHYAAMFYNKLAFLLLFYMMNAGVAAEGISLSSLRAAHLKTSVEI